MSDVITPAPSSESISQSVLLAQVTGEELFLIASDGRSFTTAKEYFPASNPNATTGPTLTGPVSFYLNQTQTWKITNYDFPVNYVVTVSAGTVVINQDTITITAPTTPGPFTLTVNGQNYVLNAIYPVIQTPEITNPTDAQTQVGAQMTFSASAFAMQNGVDVYQSTNWQLATDAAFGSIAQQSIHDITNISTWSVSDLLPNTTYYVRVQYQGAYGELSSYSNVVSFSTKTVFTPSHIVSKISNDINYSNYGVSVSLNAQGTVALVGASGENSNNGAAYIYSTVDGVSWTQVARLSSALNGTAFGYGVCLNAQGNLAAISATNENSSTGAVYIYTTTDGITWTQTSRLTSNVASSYFGTSLSVNAQGNIIIVGAYNENGYVGAAYIYNTTDNLTWNQAARLTTNLTNSYFGRSVSINDQGTTVIVGAPYENSSIGASYIFTTTDGITWSQTARLNSGVSSGQFGRSVALNAQGNIAIIGAYNESSYAGAVYIFSTTDNITWILTIRLSPGVANSNFGISVALNAQGYIAIIGAYNQNASTGAAYVYTTPDGVTWTQSAILTPTTSYGYFGTSVSLDTQGNLALIGATYDNNTGAAYFSK
jgi:hypothetical protein